MIEFTVSLRLRFSERNVDNVSRTRELVKQAYKIELCSLPNEARGDYARLLFNGIKILNCLRKKKGWERELDMVVWIRYAWCKLKLCKVFTMAACVKCILMHSGCICSCILSCTLRCDGAYVVAGPPSAPPVVVLRFELLIPIRVVMYIIYAYQPTYHPKQHHALRINNCFFHTVT